MAAVRLKIGKFESVQRINRNDAKVIFDVPLDQAEYEVTAEMLDESHQVIAGAYYTYCTKLER